MAIHDVLNKYFKYKISINDVCVYVPAWFSVLACLAVFGMAWEASGNPNAGVAAAAIMSIIPAHIMRSVAGGYDNESIAMFAMCSTFFWWMLTVRNARTWPIGIVAGLAYVYMVAAWGGYVFVLNLIGVHALFLVLTGNFSKQLHRGYSLFYVIGTIGAMQWPVVGWAPLKSLEQLGPCFVFMVLQLLAVFARHREQFPDESMIKYRLWQLTVLGGCVGVLAVVAGILAPMGYFGPLSARVRGLFVQHTHTGNPLVDSVAEHQATGDEMYWMYFNMLCYAAPMALPSLFWNRSPAKYFMLCFALIAMYFSKKMVRLVLLLSPAASILGGITIASTHPPCCLLSGCLCSLFFFFVCIRHIPPHLCLGGLVNPRVPV